MSEPGVLNREDLNPNPVAQFGAWLEIAVATLGPELATAMCLSTVGPDGSPEGRMMLLKHADDSGFVFYTNEHSNKGQSLNSTAAAALTFFWGPSQKQVRVQGRVERVADTDADAYFHSRPRLSQVGAWASQQSALLDSRETLERRVKEITDKYGEGEIPRPSHWTGFRVIPSRIEFWQGRPNRLHDRFVYTLQARQWKIDRLYP